MTKTAVRTRVTMVTLAFAFPLLCLLAAGQVGLVLPVQTGVEPPHRIALSHNVDVCRPRRKRPRSPLLPERLVTVFGLESSGTTFLTDLLESSLGVAQRDIVKGWRDSLSQERHRQMELQHISLPFGGLCQGQYEIVPAMYPAACVERMEMRTATRPGTGSVVDQLCQDLLDSDHHGVVYPKRFFVNITSHIEWYLSVGVEVSALIVVRDRTVGSLARSFVHCEVTKFRETEEQLGLAIIQEALKLQAASQKGIGGCSSPPVAIISYETLMHLGVPYLNMVLDNLKLPQVSNQLTVRFIDGNARYIKSFDELTKGIPRNSFSNNSSEGDSSEDFGTDSRAHTRGERSHFKEELEPT